MRDSLEWRRGQVGTCCYVFFSVVALVALTTFYAVPSIQTLTLAGTYDAINGLLHRYAARKCGTAHPPVVPNQTLGSLLSSLVASLVSCLALHPASSAALQIFIAIGSFTFHWAATRSRHEA